MLPPPQLFPITPSGRAALAFCALSLGTAVLALVVSGGRWALRRPISAIPSSSRRTRHGGSPTRCQAQRTRSALSAVCQKLNRRSVDSSSSRSSWRGPRASAADRPRTRLPPRLEGERQRVDAIAEARVGRTVGEDVAEVAAAASTRDLSADHAVARVSGLEDCAVVDRPVEARPPEPDSNFDSVERAGHHSPHNGRRRCRPREAARRPGRLGLPSAAGPHTAQR